MLQNYVKINNLVVNSWNLVVITGIIRCKTFANFPTPMLRLGEDAHRTEKPSTAKCFFPFKKYSRLISNKFCHVIDWWKSPTLRCVMACERRWSNNNNKRHLTWSANVEIMEILVTMVIIWNTYIYHWNKDRSGYKPIHPYGQLTLIHLL